MSDFLQTYRAHAAERAALGIPPLPLSAQQVAEVIELLKNPPKGEEGFLVELLSHRVPPGVDDAAKVKASFLAAVAHGDIAVALVSKTKATELLGTMVGGYNVKPLIDLLDDSEVAAVAAEGLKKTLLMFDAFHDVAEKCKAGNAKAKEVMQSWADAQWFLARPEVPKTITVTRCPAKPTPTTSRPRPMPGVAPTSRCTTWPCSRTRVPTRPSGPRRMASVVRYSSSKTSRKKVIWWLMWAMWWARVRAANRPPTA
jgi:aconitate hydratase 2/2-methylisocitrate dehydratase